MYNLCGASSHLMKLTASAMALLSYAAFGQQPTSPAPLSKEDQHSISGDQPPGAETGGDAFDVYAEVLKRPRWTAGTDECWVIGSARGSIGDGAKEIHRPGISGNRLGTRFIDPPHANALLLLVVQESIRTACGRISLRSA